MGQMTPVGKWQERQGTWFATSRGGAQGHSNNRKRQKAAALGSGSSEGLMLQARSVRRFLLAKNFPDGLSRCWKGVSFGFFAVATLGVP